MRLDSLHLVNFRQHADTRIEFGSGLTGIMGPNGSGKSTLLEAIAWSLYGNSAARGTRDTIRRLGAGDGRVPVRVELCFELGGHRYRVIRTLSQADCFLDDNPRPVATTVTGVTDFLERRLGMTRSEFFHTYFTGQKELDVMNAFGPADRARFLSRVLGYDRLDVAQERLRERRRSLVAEATGLRQGMADPAVVRQTLSDTQARLSMARVRAASAERSREGAAAALEALVPEWKAARELRERVQMIRTEVRLGEGELLAAERDSRRISKELEQVGEALKALDALQREIEPLSGTGAALEEMEMLARADARRQTLLDRLRNLATEDATLAERAAQLETAPLMVAEAERRVLDVREELVRVEKDLEVRRTEWARDLQEAQTRRGDLRTQYTDLLAQRSTLMELGSDSPCPTCGRPLGNNFDSVLSQVNEKLEMVRVDGNYYRQRVEQLTPLPSPIVTAEEVRRGLQDEWQLAERRLQRIRTAVSEGGAVAEQRARLALRVNEATEALSLLPAGYDAVRHSVLRESATRLAVLEKKIASLAAVAGRGDALRQEFDTVCKATDGLRERLRLFGESLAELSQSDARHDEVKKRYQDAETRFRQCELDAVAAAGEAARATEASSAAENAAKELGERQTRLDVLETDRKLHDELDRAFSEIRMDLNSRVRPELSEISSGLLSELTDGRYKALEFDDDYRMLVVDDEDQKPVISGGEEDLCNLVLRLSISQMIADRAGQVFSLLILDEIFGSLDESRRNNVVELLRKLHERFAQVIVITHIDQVREGLDRVLQLRFDEASRSSVVETVR